MFEGARGAMVYGWFFYPLITLASEQFGRIMEAAAKQRCQQLGIDTKITRKNGKTYDRKFYELIEDLAKQGAIVEQDVRRWDATRNLRNMSAHAERQSIYSTGMALDSIDSTVDLLGKLFPPMAPSAPAN